MPICTIPRITITPVQCTQTCLFFSKTELTRQGSLLYDRNYKASVAKLSFHLSAKDIIAPTPFFRDNELRCVKVDDNGWFFNDNESKKLRITSRFGADVPAVIQTDYAIVQTMGALLEIREND